MALLLKYCGEGSAVPENAIRAPGTETFVVLDEDRGPNAFGLGKATGRGIEAWFPWGGKVDHTDGPFSFLIKNPDFCYTWVPAEKVLANQNQKFKPLEVDGVCPASFSGRLGKVQLSKMVGWTSWEDKEIVRDEDEVVQSHLLCARRKHEECCLEYHGMQVGRYPPADAVQAKDCQQQSYVVLSREFAEPTFGRASLNAYRDGLQAWFPYDGAEHEREKFEVLRHRSCLGFYWAPIAEVSADPGHHEIVRLGDYSPAIIQGLLGKAKIADVRGWTSYDGDETEHERDVVLAGKVLCYKDHDDCLAV